jgi:hypothetical protein
LTTIAKKLGYWFAREFTANGLPTARPTLDWKIFRQSRVVKQRMDEIEVGTSE